MKKAELMQIAKFRCKECGQMFDKKVDHYCNHLNRDVFNGIVDTLNENLIMNGMRRNDYHKISQRIMDGADYFTTEDYLFVRKDRYFQFFYHEWLNAILTKLSDDGVSRTVIQAYEDELVPENPVEDVPQDKIDRIVKIMSLMFSQSTDHGGVQRIDRLISFYLGNESIEYYVRLV